MLFKIASLVAGSTGLLESKSIVGLNGGRWGGVGSGGFAGTRSCIKLQRACACADGNELRIPTRLRTAATAERLSRMTIVLRSRGVERNYPRLAPASDSFYSRLLSEFDWRISFPLALAFYPSAGPCQRLTNYRASILKQLHCTLSHFELKLAPGCKSHKNGRGDFLGPAKVERLYDASAQLARVVVDDRDRDLPQYLIASGVGAGACAHAIGRLSRAAVGIRVRQYSCALAGAANERFTEGDCQPIKIG